MGPQREIVNLNKRAFVGHLMISATPEVPRNNNEQNMTREIYLDQKYAN